MYPRVQTPVKTHQSLLSHGLPVVKSPPKSCTYEKSRVFKWVWLRHTHVDKKTKRSGGDGANSHEAFEIIESDCNGETKEDSHSDTRETRDSHGEACVGGRKIEIGNNGLIKNRGEEKIGTDGDNGSTSGQH